MADIDRAAAVRSLGFQLGSLLAEARNYLQSAAESLTPPISPAAFTVLQWLHARGPTRAGDLAEALAMDRSALSRLTKQFRDQGLVETAASVADARAVILALTPRAQASVADALARKGDAFDARLADWSMADIQHLTTLLRRLNGGSEAAES